MKRFTLALVLAFAGCQPHPTSGTCEELTIVDTDVMAFLSKARAAHHEANVKEQEGRTPEAIAALEQLARSPLPRPGTLVPEVEEVLADTLARLADLKLASGDLDGAERDVTAGLLHAPAPTYFRGHLLEIQGVIEEQRAAKLADAGKTEEAARARARAVTVLRQAVDIQDHVIKNATAKGDP